MPRTRTTLAADTVTAISSGAVAEVSIYNPEVAPVYVLATATDSAPSLATVYSLGVCYIAREGEDIILAKRFISAAAPDAYLWAASPMAAAVTVDHA